MLLTEGFVELATLDVRTGAEIVMEVPLEHEDPI